MAIKIPIQQPHDPGSSNPGSTLAPRCHVRCDRGRVGEQVTERRTSLWMRNAQRDVRNSRAPQTGKSSFLEGIWLV